MNKLEDWFSPTDRIFKIFKHHCIDYSDKDKRRVFIDRNSKVLLVGHLDTIHHPVIKHWDGDIIKAPGLDDRLGCWIAFKLSHQLKADLLLTDNEESAASTAGEHTCKKYNWVVEFDRHGKDVVTYDAGSALLETALEEFFKVGWGTFSDICWLNTTAACMNVGIGYYQEHTKQSFANLLHTNHQIKLFKQFYHKYKDKEFVRDKEFIPYYFGCGHYTGSYSYAIDFCDLCDKDVGFEKLTPYLLEDGIRYHLCKSCENTMFGFSKNEGNLDKGERFCPHCKLILTKNQEICPVCLVYVEPSG